MDDTAHRENQHISQLFVITVKYAVELFNLAGRCIYEIISRTCNIPLSEIEDPTISGLYLGISNIFMQIFFVAFSVFMVCLFAATILFGCLWVGGVIVMLSLFNLLYFGTGRLTFSWVNQFRQQFLTDNLFHSL